MATIYTDTTNAYDISTTSFSSDRNILDQVIDGIGAYYNGIASVIRAVIPFEGLMSLKNERLRDEQGANLNADQTQIEADNKTAIVVVVLLVVAAIAFIIIKKHNK